MNKVTNLPQANTDELKHSQQLVDLITTEIASNDGQMSFARYMELCLYAPGLGYYAAGKHKFGEQGDFVTAPEISPLFSYCLARHCQNVLTDLPAGDILEFGAGSGIMAAHLLLELERFDCLPGHYYILELSADLHEHQQQTLEQHCPHLIARVSWLDSLPEKPMSGIILANEVMDAMPVNLFQIENKQLFERMVSYEKGSFVWQLAPIGNKELLQQARILQEKYALDNYQSEINLALPAWIESVHQSLQQGVVILIDYGFPQAEFYHRQRYTGTLMCHYKHHAHPDPLILPGLQDITAHVDFTQAMDAAENIGFSIESYGNQASFLLASGLLDYLNSVEDVERHYALSQQVKRLTMPTEMGELFKVLKLVKS